MAMFLVAKLVISINNLTLELFDIKAYSLLCTSESMSESGSESESEYESKSATESEPSELSHSYVEC